MLLDFGYTQQLEIDDPLKHQAHPPQQHPLVYTQRKIHLHSLFKYISSFLHPSSMMSRVVVVDYSSKEVLLQTLTLLTASCTPVRWSTSSIVTLGSTLTTCFIFTGLSSRPPLQCRPFSLLDWSLLFAALLLL